MIPLDPALKATHEANKREVFDAMRAYHESEIAHKQDAVGMLTALLAAAGAVFAAIVVPEKPTPYALPLAVITALVTSGLAWIVVQTTNKKIEEDHKVYQQFGDEYVRACEVLGVFDPLEIEGKQQPVKIKKPIGHGEGWRYTQKIVRSVGVAIGGLAWLAVVFVSLTSDQKDTRAAHWSLVTTPCCTSRCKIPQPHVLLIEETSGRVLYLTATDSLPAIWKAIPVDPTLEPPLASVSRLGRHNNPAGKR